jgi:hypothetical protein
MPNVTRDDIYLNRQCAACHGELIIIPVHGLFVQHEDAECEAHHSPMLEAPSCIHCRKTIHALFSPEGLVWVDDATGGDVCGWDGGNEPHAITAAPTTTHERDTMPDNNPGTSGLVSDYNDSGNVADIGVYDVDADVSYHFWTNGTAVGYEIHFPGNRIEFFYLNPSDGSDDGVPTVFAYRGTEADPAADMPLCHFVVTPDDATT